MNFIISCRRSRVSLFFGLLVGLPFISDYAHADKRFPAGTPQVVQDAVLSLERRAGIYVWGDGCAVGYASLTDYFSEAMSGLVNNDELVRVASLDVLVAAVRYGGGIEPEFRDAINTELENMLTDIRNSKETRERLSLLHWYLQIDGSPSSAKLSMLQKALFSSGSESWLMAIESVELLASLGGSDSRKLLSDRLELEKNKNSDFAMRIRAGIARVDVLSAASVSASPSDVIYGSMLSAKIVYPASVFPYVMSRHLEIRSGAEAKNLLSRLATDRIIEWGTVAADARSALTRLNKR